MNGEARPQWPTGKTSGAALTFDFDVDTYTLAEDPSAAGKPGALSQGMYEPRVGVPLILELLERRGVAATFFIPGQVAERFPDSVRAIVAGGHEIAAHGYTHTSPTELSAREEEAELVKAKKILSGFGVEVSGYRSPSWEFSPATLGLLEAHGFAYSSNLMDDIRPYLHPGGAVAELPVQWILDDAAHWWMDLASWTKKIATTAEVESIWSEELAGIADLGGCCVFTMHPAVIGRPARLAFLERMIDLVQAREDVYLATCAQLAACLPRPTSSLGSATID
jgi:peptidoglycan/xylan/chitin deacetylase (PgdA/CDA1 family)